MAITGYLLFAKGSLNSPKLPLLKFLPLPTIMAAILISHLLSPKLLGGQTLFAAWLF